MEKFTIHTRTALPKRFGSAPGFAYSIKLNGKTVYYSAPVLFTTRAKARSAAREHINRDGHTLGLSQNDYI